VRPASAWSVRLRGSSLNVAFLAACPSSLRDCQPDQRPQKIDARAK
jgi:hypothetical protein